MENEWNIIRMEIYYLKVTILMINKKDMENIFKKMMNIIKDNIKVV